MYQTPSRLRIYLFRICTLVLVLKIISDAWSENHLEKTSLSNNLPVAETVLTPSLEERTLLLQLKIALGSLNYLREKAKDYTSASFPLETFEESIKRSFSEGSFIEISSKDNTDDSALQLYIKKYAFARYLRIETAQKKYKELISSHSTKRPYLKLAQNVVSSLEDNILLKLNQDEQKALGNLGLFSKLLLVDLDNSKQLEGEIDAVAKAFFKNFTIALCFTVIFIIAAILCFIFYAYKIAAKKLKSSFQNEAAFADYALEIFCLYLAAMFFLPKLIGKLIEYGYLTNPLVANILCIAPLALLIFWPQLFSIDFSKIRSSLGLYIKSFSAFAKDMIAGPTAYLAYWVILLSVLVIYSLVMLKLGINTENSAHPVVPLLASTKERMNIVYVFVLAVIIAPLIEEIMFRGAFYSWLRTRFSAGFSILFSSFIFAAVHPQGAIGVLPLTFIGILLAILREWRGSLVAPMIAHACFNAGTLSMVLFIFRS